MSEYFAPTDTVMKEKIWDEIGLNQNRIKEAVEIIKEWQYKQPHLPKEEDDTRLERWLINCKNRLEKTKTALDMRYTARNYAPEFMTEWDVSSEWLQNLYKTGFGFPSSKLTPEGDRVIFEGVSNSDSTNFNFIHAIRFELMSYEVRLCEDYWRSNILVYDLKNFTISHMHKISPTVVKKFALLFLNCYKCRISAIVFLHAPQFAEYIINIGKSVVKPKLAKRFYVFGSDLTEFYKIVPRDVCPTEYGGTIGSIEECNERWRKNLGKYREYLLDQEKLKTDESKRPGKSIDCGDIFGIEGSFRKLDID